MDTLALSFYLFFFIITHTTSTSNNICPPSTCGVLAGPSPVRFPFRLTDRQPAGCGYPGFDLFCNNNSQTALNLPSGEVTVKQIEYYAQTLIVDPQFCVPNKILNFSLIGTPFTGNYFRNYTFFNCSSHEGRPAYRGAALYCLSGFNYIVSVLPTDFITGIPATNCRIISTLLIPARWYGDVASVTKLELQWFMPTCRSCEIDGGTCGTKKKHPSDVVCFGGYNSKSEGLSKRAKYGLIIGLGVPGLLFTIVVLCVTNKRNRTQRLQETPNISSISLTPQPTREPGLDRSTMESYPKSVLELEVLPTLNESTCPICLSNYKPREEVRTIPDCSHYFHVQCIDEWLSVNATCPVCRNSQKSGPC